MSPMLNMTLNCSPEINGFWEINELWKDEFTKPWDTDGIDGIIQPEANETKTKRKIISKKKHHMTKKHFFTPCERFIGVEVDDEDAFKFYRVADGTYLGSIQKYNIKVVQDNKGGCSMIIGLIDLMGRVFYEWSLEAFVHLSTESIILIKTDNNTVKLNTTKLR
jgi:hypothetical protein